MVPTFPVVFLLGVLVLQVDSVCSPSEYSTVSSDVFDVLLRVLLLDQSLSGSFLCTAAPGISSSGLEPPGTSKPSLRERDSDDDEEDLDLLGLELCDIDSKSSCTE